MAPVMIASLVLKGSKALIELYGLIKAKKVDEEDLGDLGDNIQAIIESVKQAKQKK